MAFILAIEHVVCLKAAYAGAEIPIQPSVIQLVSASGAEVRVAFCWNRRLAVLPREFCVAARART
jgi:hypothetical protein